MKLARCLGFGTCLPGQRTPAVLGPLAVLVLESLDYALWSCWIIPGPPTSTLNSDPDKASRGGWAFTDEEPDPVFGVNDLREVYATCNPGFKGRYALLRTEVHTDICVVMTTFVLFLERACLSCEGC